MLRIPLLITLLVLVTQACFATDTLFWSQIGAIDQLDSSSSSSSPAHPAFHFFPKRSTQSSGVKCTHPVPRVSFYSLTPAEQSAWIYHFRMLSRPGKSIFIRGGSFMDDLALVHIGLQEEMHYNSCFLPCHTAFIRAFYSLMRVTGYKGREAYWDIEHDSSHMQNAALWRSFGGDGLGGGIKVGPFRSLKCGMLPAKQPGHSVYKPHLVTRHFNDGWNKKPLTRGDMYSHLLSPALFSSTLSSPNYTSLRLKLERTLHSWVHQSIGGEMWMFSAPCEPAFWLLHAEIDRLWRTWQHRTGKYYDYEGHRRIRHKDGSTEVRLASLDDEVDFYGLFVKVTVREVMHPRRGILCYRYDRLWGGEVDSGF